MTANPLLQVRKLGQSIWLDYIRRDILKNGQVARMIEEDGITGITSNPSIFAQVISEHDEYDEAISKLSHNGIAAKEIYETLALQDIQHAAGLFRRVYDVTNGYDGFVSIEVSPHLAHDTQQTVAEAKRLWYALDRPNIMIKVPATSAGLPAIEQLIAAGINVNVTLLFGIERYREVSNAFMNGLETRVRAHLPIDHIASVASFFLSRIDVVVDKYLTQLAQSESGKSVKALQGLTAIACARLAYQHYLKSIKNLRWQSLAKYGVHPQRLLWASTGTKNPDYSDIKYVEALIGKDTVNTLPLKTFAAYREHGQPALRIEQQLDEARALLDKLRKLGIDQQAISQQLEDEGIKMFITPFDRLLEQFIPLVQSQENILGSR